MAKKGSENIEFANTEIEDNVQTTYVNNSNEYEPRSYSEREKVLSEEPMISCLRDEKVIVRFIGKKRGIVNNPDNPFFGGMGETCRREYVVPKTSTDNFVNVLTNSEKKFLEDYMGLKPNSLSIYLKENNFWETAKVVLKKGDNYFNLSNPEDYIKYKILLLYKDEVASSLEEYKNSPKVTHLFYISKEGDEIKQANDNLSTSSKAYMLYGELKNNLKKLVLVLETCDGKAISKNVTQDIVNGHVERVLKTNPKLFVQIAEDPFLDTKVLIKDAINCGIIKRIGDFYYYDNKPMCKENQDPTLKSACEYINAPRNQEIKFSIEAKIKALEE